MILRTLASRVHVYNRDMYPHRIRLRGPWECEPRSGDPPPAPRHMTLPCRWVEGGLTNYSGKVRFRRRFGSPTNLEVGERVWLTFDGVEGTWIASLNGEGLGNSPEFDVT